MDQSFMKTRPVLPLVISMALPMTLSMLVNSLYNIVDSYFVAKISEDAMTALSLVYPIQNLVNAVTVGFGIGVNAAIAYFLGAKKQELADRSASMGLLLSVLHGVLLTVCCTLCMPFFLGLFTDSSEILSLGLRYARVVFLFSIPFSISMVFEKVYQSVGKMTTSMVSLLIGCITNIILDPLMIFGIGPFPALGIEGAALATGIGQSASLVFYLIVYAWKKLPVNVSFRNFSSAGNVIRRMYGVGIPAALNLALASLLITCLNAILAAFSQSYVLILGVYYKLQSFLYLTANGVVQGIRPLMGYNYGAGEHRRVGQIFRTSLLLIAVVMLVGTVLCLAIPQQLLGLFTTNPVTVAEGAKALRIICIGFLVSSVSVTAAGSLEGLGKGLASLWITLCRYAVIILPAAWLLSRTALGASGVWHAFWITEFATAAVAALIYRKSTAFPKESPLPQRQPQ